MSKKPNFRPSLSSALKYNISKTSLFYSLQKHYINVIHYCYFAFLRKLLTVTVKSDTQQWLNFVTTVSKLTLTISGSMFLILKGRSWWSVYHRFWKNRRHRCDPFKITVTQTPFWSNCTRLLPAAELSWAIMCLRPSKYVGFDGIPLFIINGCSTVFIPLLTHLLYLSVASETKTLCYTVRYLFYILPGSLVAHY